MASANTRGTTTIACHHGRMNETDKAGHLPPAHAHLPRSLFTLYSTAPMTPLLSSHALVCFAIVCLPRMLIS